MNKITEYFFLTVIVFIFSYKVSDGQNQYKIDSLNTVFKQTSDDSLKNISLEQLYNEYFKDNWRMAINTAKSGITLFEEIRPDYTVSWYHKLGRIYMEQGLYTLSFNAYSKALAILNKEQKNTGYILSDIAKLYYYQEKYDKSIGLYKNALAQFQKLKKSDKKNASLGIAKTYNKLGIVYELKGDTQKSEEFYKKALQLRLDIDSKKDIVDSYTSLGFFYNVIQEYDRAVYYFTKGLEICTKYNSYHYFNDLHLFRSISYSQKQLFDKAYNDIDTAKQYALEFDQSDIARVYYFYAQTDFEKDDYTRLKTDAEKAMQYADSFNLVSIKTKTLNLLVNASKKHTDYKNAFRYQVLLTDYSELNKTEKLLQLEHDVELVTEKSKNLELGKTNESLKRDNNLFQLSILFGILIFILLILLLFLNTRKNRKIKNALLLAEEEKENTEKAKHELEDSSEMIRSQAALAEILRNVTGKERSAEDFLQDALEKLLALPWLNIISKGSIFLTDKNGNLKMVAEKDLGEVALRCALIKPGECLCGKALSEKEMQYCNHIDHNHEIRFKTMTEHGHYNLPIKMQNKVLGVLNIYTEHNHQKTDHEVKFLQTVCDTLASVINRKKSQTEILKTKNDLERQKKELEEKNKAIKLYSTQVEQQSQEQEKLNQIVSVQKREVEIRRKEAEDYAKQLEEKAKEQEALNQQLFAQKLEVEQRNLEAQQYLEQIEKHNKEQEQLNQQLFAQKLEVEQRNYEVELYSKQIEEKAKEQERLNQQLFAQKLEVEQRNYEVELYSKQLEEKAKGQEALNQQLFAQKLEVEQRNSEVEQYLKQIEEQKKEQDKLNQQLFAQKLEVEQRNFEVELYSKQIEEKSKEQEVLNQQLFAQKSEVEQRNSEVELYSKQIEEKAKEQEALNQQLFAQKLEVEQRNSEVEQYLKQIEEQKKEQDKLNQKLFAQNLEVDQKSIEIERYSKKVETLRVKAENTLNRLNESINYSKYIQDSMLPNIDFMKNLIPGDLFVYFKPKEIIGGDFYYAKQLNDYLIFAVADCTGHGIPGALITMLGISFLDDIVINNLTNNTGEALNIMRKRFKNTFDSYGGSMQNKNGLDIALCAINLKTNVMLYSGAFNSLILIRNDELIEYKATRNPIGSYPVEKDFETNEIQLKNNDVIYLFSDGYADQLGGDKNRKLSRRKFKNFLFEIYKYPLEKQHIYIDKIMQKWMGKNAQVDDMTIMGIKWGNGV